MNVVVRNTETGDSFVLLRWINETEFYMVNKDGEISKGFVSKKLEVIHPRPEPPTDTTAAKSTTKEIKKFTRPKKS